MDPGKIYVSSKCAKWKANPEVNPDTGKKITTSGKIYKNLLKECKTESPARINPRSFSAANLLTMKNPELKELAKQQGYRNYGKLNKHDLVRLLINGALPPPPKYISRRLKEGVGVPLDQLFTAGDKSPGNKWVYESKKVDDGYMIRGVDLEGLFGSTYIPDKTVTRLEEVYRDYFTDEEMTDEDEEPAQELVTRTIRGGWFVSDKVFTEVVAFLESLQKQPQPKSLKELAINVAAARKIPKGVLPKLIVQEVKVYRKNNR
jgi:hypothetical protein